MAFNTTIISFTIPQLPKESILDGTSYLDWQLHMMTFLQQHRLWNIVQGTKPHPKTTSIISSVEPT